MQITKDKVVSIDYTLTDPQGRVLDSSEGRQPLSYLQGTGSIIPGLERELEGRSAGERLQVTIEPADAYGERDERLVQAIPREAFGGIDNIQVGMQFQAQSPTGQRAIVRVVDVADDEITVDANHPLAGVALTFDVTVRDVRDATAEELAHGHVHGPDGHAHG